MTFPLAHNIRPACAADVPLVVHSWVNEYRHAPAARFIRDAEFFPDQRQLVLDLIQTSDALVACGADDTNHVFGYIVFGPGAVVSWCFVKAAYRGLGLADTLLKAAFPNRGPDDVLYALQAGRMWGELEPRGRGITGPGAMTRRQIYYRPALLSARPYTTSASPGRHDGPWVGPE